MLKTIVCDDEAPAVELMEGMLRDTGQVAIEGTYLSVREAIDRINQGGIDLAVLDIEMPELSGVEASTQITADPKPLIVFATAHPEYAVEAFGIDAIDYILKPFDQVRVEKAVEKAARMHRLIAESEEEVAEEADAQRADPPAMLRIKDAGRYYFIPRADVIWIEAAGDYSLLHTADRVHRSAIVSVAHIREIRMRPKGEAQIFLTDDITVRTSRSYRDTIQKLIDEM